MKKITYNIILFSALALSAMSCIESTERLAPGEGITFDVVAVKAPETKAPEEKKIGQEVLVSTDSKVVVAFTETAEMENIEQEIETRATRYNSESELAGASQTFKVWGWNTTASNTIVYTDETVSKTGGKWKPATTKTWKYNAEYAFEALYPSTTGLTSFTPSATPGGLTFSYAHQTGAAAPSDYMLAYFKGLGDNTKGVAKLVFTHPFTCVKFVQGSGITINSITVSGLYASGSCTVAENAADADHQGTYYSYNWTPGTANHSITCSAGDELLLIPQNPVSTDVTMTANVTIDGVTFDAVTTLSTGNWEAGKVNTYTFNRGDKTINVAVTDKVVGRIKKNLVISNTGTAKGYIRAAIVAGWYKEGYMVAPWDPNSGTFVDFNNTDWTKVGDFYYYKNPVEGGHATGSALFTSYTAPEAPIIGANLKMTIIAQGVIWDANKERAKVAWGAANVTDADLN